MRKKFSILFLLLLLLTTPSVIGLLHVGFPLTDDGNWMVIRLSAFYENLRDGQLPVRFLSRLNHGYGYPVADFLYPGFMYLGSLIHVLGFNFSDSIKIILGLSLISSAAFSFLWLKKLFDNFSAFVGALVYLYSPYHLYDVYQRGSVGEVLSLAILPFILWQIEKKNIFFTSLGISALLISHNTLALLFVPFVILYAILRNKVDIKNFFISLSLGFGVSAFFTLPAIYDLQFTVFSKTQVSEWSKYFTDINLIGISSLLILFLSFILLILRRGKLKNQKLSFLFLTIGLISLFLSSSLSSMLWSLLPANFIQFPFRLLSIVIPSIAFLSALSVSSIDKNKKIVLGTLILLMAFFSSLLYIVPKSYQYHPDSFYSTNQDTTTVKNEYMPKWVREIPAFMFESKVENITGDEKINIEKISPNKVIFQTELVGNRTIAVNAIYFPGWIAKINGKQSNISYNNPKGIIELNLPKGYNNVEIYFEETPVRMLSNLISISSLGSVFLLQYFIRYKKIKV